VRVLALALSDEKPSVRWNAAKTLAQMGTSAVAALKDLQVAMTSPEPGTALWARTAVACITQDPMRHLPVLIAALRDPRQYPGMAAAALGMLGPAAASAVEPLAELLSHPEADHRWSAALALSRIGQAAAPACGRLATALSDPDEKVRWYAAVALGGIGAEAAPAVPALSAALSDFDDDVVGCAADALQSIGVHTPEVLAALAASEDHPNPAVAQRVRSALAALSSQAG
jgi:HEAT repeat protein